MGAARYPLLCAALFVLLWAHSWSAAWIGDFWIYTATVRELATSPLHPRHPLLGTDYAFVFLSPYTWVLGLASRAFRIGPVQTLVLQGFVNLALLLYAIHAFVTSWLRRPAAAFYALLFILFLWGADPWRFSSFFHLRSLAFVLPYPSTFAFAAALLTLAVFPRLVASGGLAWTAITAPVLAVLCIQHPVNGLFLALGLVAASGRAPRPYRHWTALVLVLAAGLALSFVWPLFPVADLWFGQLDRVHEGNDTMYQGPLPRIAPALIGLPWLLLRLKRDRRDPLALLGLALGALVVYGGLSGQWTLGRLISHAAIVLQVALADACVALEERLVPRRPALGRLLAPAVAVVLVAVSWPTRVKPTLEESWRGDLRWLSFLESRVAPYDVVLTDLDTCWYVPSFGGKVVAYPMQLPFVTDHAERLRAVTRFFLRDTAPDERADIIKTYRITHLLFPKASDEDWAERLEELRPLGRTVYSDADYELLRLEPAP